ncbi:MAG TPA: hypothetical protein ENH06_02060 [bacterium]|nr:hypothetical protein [bacterium]
MNYKIKPTLIFLLLIFIIFIVFLINPLFKKINENSKIYVSQENIFVNLEKKAKNINNFQSYYKKYKKEIEKIDLLFINSNEPIEFIKFLETEAQASNIHLEMSPSSLRKLKNEPWSFLSFQLILKGSFSNISMFLEKLESAPYLIKIENFTLKKSSQIKKEETKNLTATLLIKVYSK